MKKYFTIIFVLFSYFSFAQDDVATIEKALETFDFLQDQIIDRKDTITYYLKNYTKKRKPTVKYLL